jgi:tol-pal system protein YbgF
MKKPFGMFQKISGRLICLLFSAVVITGCVTIEEKNRMQWEINALKAEVAEIKKKSKSIETQFPDRQKHINEKISELEETQRNAAKTAADLLVRIQYLTNEVQMLTGRFEEARYLAEKNSAELKENKEMLIAKMKQLELAIEDLKGNLAGAEAAETPSKKEAVEPARKIEEAEDKKEVDKTDDTKEVKKEDDKEVGKEGDAQEEKADVKDVYMAAYEAYKEGKTVEAREQFKSLLMDYSENDYSDNARFWIAESYYKDGNFEDAILAYEELFKMNPASDKVPGAMLKQGLAFYALKDKKTGRIILEKLVEKFPESDQAKLAQRKMDKSVPSKKR